jgi:hypothetical protein
MKLDLTWLRVYIEVVIETLRSIESVLEMKRYMIACLNKTYNVGILYHYSILLFVF